MQRTGWPSLRCRYCRAKDVLMGLLQSVARVQVSLYLSFPRLTSSRFPAGLTEAAILLHRRWCTRMTFFFAD